MIRQITALLLASLLPSARAEDPSEAFHEDRLAAMVATTKTSIAAGRTPGAVLWLERNGTTWQTALGRRAVKPNPEPTTADTIYDAASLTKVIATTTAIMKLVDRKNLRIDDPVSRHLPEFKGNGKETITVRQLMTHHSGLRAGLSSPDDWKGTTSAIEIACAQSTPPPPTPKTPTPASPPPNSSPTAPSSAAPSTTPPHAAWAASPVTPASSPPPPTSPASAACSSTEEDTEKPASSPPNPSPS